MAFQSIELFAGAGGLALGVEKAGFEVCFLNDINKDACQTLKMNRSTWNIHYSPIETIDFYSIKKSYSHISLITGGFPCQPFSHAGKRLGLEDTRGTLFYEFARAIQEIKPDCFLAENVKGLLHHDNGHTLKIILSVFEQLGYHLYCKVLNAQYYEVAQKRERLFIVGFKNKCHFSFPEIKKSINIKDVLEPGQYYKNFPSISNYPKYSSEKEKYFALLKEGQNWKNLPLELQKKYLGKMFLSGGGKTGILKRLDWNSPSPTLLCTPSQKQTERCHPNEIRPLTIREYARIQSFPDEWNFCGSIASQYKQIGNAVPVNLAYHMAMEIKKYLSV